MNYVWKPTLEHIALVKIAATLWNQDDVKDLFAKFSIPSIHEELSKWVQIEAIVVEKVAKLPLPKQIKEKLLRLIRPVGFQISKWRQFHYNIGVDVPNEFSWTPRGKIDEKKTAEVMIKDESIDVTARYKLACIYCLEDDIKQLWEEMPEECSESFYSPEDPAHVLQPELVVFWTYHIKGEVDKLNSMIEERMGPRGSPYYYAYTLARSDGNQVATNYFLKLTIKELRESMHTIVSVSFQHRVVLNESTTMLDKFRDPDGRYILVLFLLLLVIKSILLLV